MNTWAILLALAPWLLLGMLIAGLLHILLPEGFIKRHLGARRFASVFKAVAVGIPMPLCSCGVIPAALGLKKDGASNGAATGFLISTPQTGVDSILVSATFLGWPFALFKVLSALFSGLCGGIIVNLFENGTSPQNSPDKHSSPPPPSDCCTTESHSCCSEQDAPEKVSTLKEMIHFAFIQLLRDIYRWLIIGILIAALITTFVPSGYLAHIPLTQGIFGMFVMLLISLPMYVCTTASVPLAASLIIAGMSPGSALVFLMAGPTTNLATLGSIFKAFGKTVTIVYLTTVASLSIILGLLFDFLLADPTLTHTHQHEPASLLHILSAVTLLLLLAYFLISDLLRLSSRPKPKSTS